MSEISIASVENPIATSPPASPPRSPSLTSSPPTNSPSLAPSHHLSSDTWDNTWGHEDAEAIFKTHQLPSLLQCTNERDKAELSYACESRQILEFEVRIAERRFRQVVLMARLHFLRLVEAQERLDLVRQDVDSTIDNAVQEAQRTMYTNGLARSHMPYNAWDTEQPL